MDERTEEDQDAGEEKKIECQWRQANWKEEHGQI